MSVSKIERVELCLVDLQPKVKRTDAIQCFSSQETPILTLTDTDGAQGTGYSYTIGQGGSSVMRLLLDHLAPQLIGKDPARIESIWRDLKFSIHAITSGAISSLALAAIDTALWDLRCKKAGLPLSVAAGGDKHSVGLYTTEGGWLHLSTEQLVDDVLQAKVAGFGAAKFKIGKPHIAEDLARVAAVRAAVGEAWDIMVDANQAFTVDEAIRRARRLEPLDIAWLEEPLPAMDVGGHRRLARASSIPIAVGESMYGIEHFRDYLQRDACSVIQVDAARVGGITPWLKVAHMAEGFNLPVCPHFLMELHISLVCAVPNGRWLEYIPQLDAMTTQRIAIRGGKAYAPTEPGLGIAWDWEKIHAQRHNAHTAVLSK